MREKYQKFHSLTQMAITFVILMLFLVGNSTTMLAQNANKILKISDSQRAYNQHVAEYYKKELNNQENVGSSLTNANYSIPIAQYEEGQSLTSIWAVKSLGIDPTTGKEIFLNRDGTVTDKWDATQEVVCGNTEPDFNGAFGFNVSYKQWSLFASFLYEWGSQQYNQTLVDRVENAIANCNELIQKAETADSTIFYKGNAERKLIMNEAIGLRAYLHFDLLRIYAPAPSANPGDKTRKTNLYLVVSNYNCTFAEV